MHLKRMRAICLLLTLCIFTLTSCGPSWKFQREKEQGLYPDTGNFPKTKWACEELDMYLYMFGYEEDIMTGEYIVNDISYRINANFEWENLNFKIYSNTLILSSNYSDSTVHAEKDLYGCINTKYSFDKAREKIICKILTYESVDDIPIPNTLTFYKVGTIAQDPSTRWQAQEINMFLDAFNDTPGYLEGKISIGNEFCYVHAIEVGNNNYYQLYVENGKINNLKVGTTSPLINMYLEINNNQIIAKLSDEFYSSPEIFSYWTYGNKALTFKPITA